MRPGAGKSWSVPRAAQVVISQNILGFQLLLRGWIGAFVRSSAGSRPNEWTLQQWKSCLGGAKSSSLLLVSGQIVGLYCKMLQRTQHQKWEHYALQ